MLLSIPRLKARRERLQSQKQAGTPGEVRGGGVKQDILGEGLQVFVLDWIRGQKKVISGNTGELQIKFGVWFNVSVVTFIS